MSDKPMGAFISPHPELANKTLNIDSLTIDITDPSDVAKIFPLLEESLKAITSGVYPDRITLYGKEGPGTAKFKTKDGKDISGTFETIEVTRKYPVTFFPIDEGLLCVLPNSDRITLEAQDVEPETRRKLIARNELLRLTPPGELPKKAAKGILRAPGLLPQPTFYEARSSATAISDGRDLRDWSPIEGIPAMLHAPKDSIMQTRFEPCSLLLSWWGKPTGAEMEMLQNELQKLEFAALVAYEICLSWAIQEYQVTTSLDSIIDAIGWSTDARRSSEKRQELRAKVWRWMLLFDSLAVIGVRKGTWREPRDGDKKRDKVDPDKLYSRDALLKIIGTRATEQGTFDNSAPPKEITFVAGPWVNQWRGNREILSSFGNTRTIASIPRGKPSGAWAACIGFALNQKWREQATKTPLVRKTKGDSKVITQKFRPFTRRILLGQLWRSDVDPEEILKSVNPERAKEYWDAAIKILKKSGIIGIYQEDAPLTVTGYGWQDAWLDQPLDIRPTGDNWKDAITINKSATAARKRTRKKAA